MNVKYIVELSAAERAYLQEFANSGSKLARKVKRAQILLAADQGHQDNHIAELIGVGTSTIYRAKKGFVEQPFDVVLDDDPRPGGSRKLSGKQEAHLVALACSEPPEGRARWTMELLADAFVVLTDHSSLSSETVRRRLAEKKIKPWQKKIHPCVTRGIKAPNFDVAMEVLKCIACRIRSELTQGESTRCENVIPALIDAGDRRC